MSEIVTPGRIAQQAHVHRRAPARARVVTSTPLSFASAAAPETTALLDRLKTDSALDVCEVSLVDSLAPIRSLFGRSTANDLAALSSFLVTVPNNTAARGALSAVSASTLGMPVVAHHTSAVYLESASNHLRLFRRMLAPTLEVVPSVSMAELATESGCESVAIVDNATLMNDSFCEQLRTLAAPTASASRPIIVGFLGALSGDHGAVDVLEGFCRLADSGLAIELHVAGSMADIETAATLLEVSARHPHRVRHTAYPVDEIERAEWFNDIDIFVHPTADRSSAQPFEIYEAAAAGCAVLASSVGAIPEQLEQIGGYLLTEGAAVDSQIKRVMQANAGIAGVRAMRERRAVRFANHRERCMPATNELVAWLKNPIGS